MILMLSVFFELYPTLLRIPSTSQYQVSFSPGAILCVFIVQGNSLPVRGSSVSQNIVPLSHVSHGAVPPLPSGRSVISFERMARTFFGTHPARNGTWQGCIPRSPRHPYSPLNRAIRFQLIGFSGSMSLECRKPVLTSMISPHSPDSTMRHRRCMAGMNGYSDEHRTNTPGCSAMHSMMARFAGRSMPKGFSPIMCLPARMMSQ